MKGFVRASLVTLVLFLAKPALSDEAGVGAAQGINHAPGQLVAISYDWDLPEEYNPGNLFFLEGVVAFYTKPNTGIGSLGLGAQYEPDLPIYVRGVMGVSGQTRTSERLGGHFQFLLKAGAGVRYRNLRVGPFYTHYSSAGIYDTNAGDDYVGLEVGIDLD